MALREGGPLPRTAGAPDQGASRIGKPIRRSGPDPEIRLGRDHIPNTKYMRDADFFKSKDSHGSQFWKALHKVKHLFKCGVIHVVGDGKRTQFWNDVWITSSPLRISFPRIYDICDNKNISVAGCAQMDWHPHLRRMLDAQALVEWNQLQVLLQGVQLGSVPDQITWGLIKSKQFTIASLSVPDSWPCD
jgi:hypothetical protein